MILFRMLKSFHSVWTIDIAAEKERCRFNGTRKMHEYYAILVFVKMLHWIYIICGFLVIFLFLKHIMCWEKGLCWFYINTYLNWQITCYIPVFSVVVTLSPLWSPLGQNHSHAKHLKQPLLPYKTWICPSGATFITKKDSVLNAPLCRYHSTLYSFTVWSQL